jgi:hypothetical protein
MDGWKTGDEIKILNSLIEHGKIVWLKEYRMTAVPYEWHPNPERAHS